MLLDERLVRAVAAGRRRGEAPRWRRAEVRPVSVKAGRRLQITTYDETQAHTRNEPPGEAAGQAIDALLAEPFGNWHVETADEVTQLRVTKRGDAQVHRARRQRPPDPSPATPHDRPKRRLLSPDDPVWRALGLADETGRIKPSRQGKFRQVEEFVRLLAPVIDDALTAGRLSPPTPARPLQVVDLGCGNAYLTFAAFQVLTGQLGLPVQMTGVDVKRQARERNTGIAAKLGWDGQLRFVEGTIASARLDEPPDVVLALHACDTATDDALARAVRWRAPLVFAAPCCHHDLQSQLRRSSPPSPYDLLTRQPILRERFADVLTDAVRAALLRLLGYRVDAVEFVASEHTPRNVLLRAVRTGAPAGDELRQKYAELTSAWSVAPALHRLLAAEVGKVLDR